MDDLTARLVDLFRRYMIEFRRMPSCPRPEWSRFRREVDALIAEHGRDAVVQAALLLPIGPLTLN
jgi:hypothetical protein